MGNERRSRVSRREVLTGLSVGVGVLAGCMSDGESDAGDGGTDPSGTDSPECGDTTPRPASFTPSDQPLTAPVNGDPDAAVTLAVYEDYACPHCADYNAEGFPELDSAYVQPGDIRYEHRDMPIPVADPGSWQAANAARAVQDRQGDEAFWSYAGAVFEEFQQLGSEPLALVQSLAADRCYAEDAIRSAATDRTYDQTVKSDRQRGIDLGAQATPTFVVNDEIVASGFGSDTVDTVSSALDSALSETG